MNRLRNTAALGAALTFAGLAGLSGCASPPPRETARSFPPSRAPSDCACTLEHRFNLCVTVEGSPALPDSTLFVREREYGRTDTLTSSGQANCFGEWPGLQRVIMSRDDVAHDSTGWFEVQTVDCCHGEARTIDFAVP